MDSSKFHLRSVLHDPMPLDSRVKRISSHHTHKKHSKDHRKTEIEDKIEAELSPIATTRKIFLYVHLQDIKNMPTTGNRMIMKVTHKANKISKLEDHYSEDQSVDLTDLVGQMPTFSITLEQDSIEDLNSMSDNPLIITFYELIPPPLKGEEDSSDVEDGRLFSEPHCKAIAQGCIDLLQCFGTKRCLTQERVFLYPIVNMKRSELLPTITTFWQMYTLMPLLRELSFCNIAFLTFESIYNAPPDIMDNTEGLMADLYFQSKVPNAKKQFDKVKICSFSVFTRTKIGMQNANIKWENLKEDAFNVNHLGLYTGVKVGLHKLFDRLLTSEGVKFNFQHISFREDEALVCNSVHRHILTKEISAILEEVVAFNRQQILVEVYRMDKPAQILLHGTLDLSVMLYPRVNACRFAVQLQHIKTKTKSKKHHQFTTADKKKEQLVTASASLATATPSFTASGTTVGQYSKDDSRHTLHEGWRSKELLHSSSNTFAIVSICLLSPITEGDSQFSRYNDSYFTKEKLKRCLKISKTMALLPYAQIAEKNYKLFDEFIGAMIDYIITHKDTSTDEAKAFFCCQLGNLSNRIIKLIATDFNKRFPTNSNLEFTRLMTTVYKELTERIYHILQNCNNPNLELCFVSDLEMLTKIVHFMNISKYMYEVGDLEIADLLFDKIWKENVNYSELHFYKFLYDTEMQNFADAKVYIRRATTERWLAMTYFVEWVDIYIAYMENRNHEETYNQALENLLIALQDFTEKYPSDADGWILMHSLYRKYSYLPGVSFTRWKYESFYGKPRRSLPMLPKSRWTLYNNCELYFHTDKGHLFYNSIQLFAQLGLYKFAEFAFSEIAKECADVERHLMTTTFKVLLKEMDKKTTVKWFDVERARNAVELRAFQAQVNGNLEYFEGATDEAIRSYGHILDLDEIQHFENYELSLLRYGYHMLEQREYEHALRAIDKCFMGENCLVANMLMGKTLYRSNHLEEAEHFYAKCTKYKIHIPNVWGYLALINLKLGNNFKALEFWKYAKLNPDNVISEEILQELEKIDYKDVFLYVDKPL